MNTRYSLANALLGSLCAILIVTAASGETLDQSQPIATAGSSFNCANPGQYFAQTLTAGVTGTMTEVGLDLTLGASSSANVLITPTALGVPNLSSPLASFTLTTTQTLVTPYVLPTPVAITIGTQYAIVVGCGSLTDFVLWFGDAANSYAGGQTYVTPDGANWFGPVGGNADFAFQTWVAGPPPPAVPTNANACKKGGWQTLVRSNRTGFKNQGDCIQYVNTGK